MIKLSASFRPAVLKGVKVHPDNPLHFDFIMDQGDQKLGGQALKNESQKLLKYFLASMTVPEKDMWVNLSPYEHNRIIPDQFGTTEMGRDLLAQDYLLKQLTASLIYPEDELGKSFWHRVYREAARQFGTTQIPVNTFNKVWIVPEKSVIYEHKGTAFVAEAKLNVMLEEDYLSKDKNEKGPAEDTSTLGSKVVREIVIPALIKEVNEGKHFAQLRQVYYSLILAAWYKKKIKDSILTQVYADKNKTAGLAAASSQEGIEDKDLIYRLYLAAFKKGVYNIIREERDIVTSRPVPRKYFSGGITNLAMNLEIRTVPDSSMSTAITSLDKAVNIDVDFKPFAADSKNAAMSVDEILNTTFQKVILNSDLANVVSGFKFYPVRKGNIGDILVTIKQKEASIKGSHIIIDYENGMLTKFATVAILEDDPLYPFTKQLFAGILIAVNEAYKAEKGINLRVLTIQKVKEILRGSAKKPFLIDIIDSWLKEGVDPQYVAALKETVYETPVTMDLSFDLDKFDWNKIRTTIGFSTPAMTASAVIRTSSGKSYEEVVPAGFEDPDSWPDDKEGTLAKYRTVMNGLLNQQLGKILQQRHGATDSRDMNALIKFLDELENNNDWYFLKLSPPWKKALIQVIFKRWSKDALPGLAHRREAVMRDKNLTPDMIESQAIEDILFAAQRAYEDKVADYFLDDINFDAGGKTRLPEVTVNNAHYHSLDVVTYMATELAQKGYEFSFMSERDGSGHRFLLVSLPIKGGQEKVFKWFVVDPLYQRFLQKRTNDLPRVLISRLKEDLVHRLDDYGIPEMSYNHWLSARPENKIRPKVEPQTSIKEIAPRSFPNVEGWEVPRSFKKENLAMAAAFKIDSVVEQRRLQEVAILDKRKKPVTVPRLTVLLKPFKDLRPTQMNVANDVRRDTRLKDHPMIKRTKMSEVHARREEQLKILDAAVEPLNPRQLYEVLIRDKRFSHFKFNVIRNDIYNDERIESHPNLDVEELSDRPIEDIIKKGLEILNSIDYTVTPKQLAELIKKQGGFEDVKKWDITQNKELRSHVRMKIRKVDIKGAMQRRQMALVILGSLKNPVSPKQLWEKLRNIEGFSDVTISQVEADIVHKSLKNHPKIVIKEPVDHDEVAKRRAEEIKILAKVKGRVTTTELHRMLTERPGFENVPQKRVIADRKYDPVLRNSLKIKVKTQEESRYMVYKEYVKRIAKSLRGRHLPYSLDEFMQMHGDQLGDYPKTKVRGIMDQFNVGFDKAMIHGGIDLEKVSPEIKTQDGGDNVRWSINAATVEELRQSNGLVPIITGIEPLKPAEFLGYSPG